MTAPGYVTISGWAYGSEPEVALDAWLDGTIADTSLAEPTFAFDLPVPAGAHVACVTPSAATLEAALDCVEFDMAPAAEAIEDGTILLTAVEPDPTGTITVRGVITGSNPPEWIDVTADTATQRVAAGDGAFRFDVQGLADDTYHICPNPAGITIATDPIDSSTTCATAIVGPLSIGTTGRAAAIEPIAPAVDHPLHLMERDGGVSVELTDGSTLWFFGDTTDDITGSNMTYFVNNTAAWASADAPTTTRDVAAAEPVRFAAPPAGTCDGPDLGKAALWPEAAVALPQDDGTDRVVVVMSKVCLGDDWLDIETVGFAVVEYSYDPTDPPIDDPIRGEVTQPHLADADAGYGRALLVGTDGFLYGYECGTYPDDWDACHVGRVDPEYVTDPGAWRYWNGGDWTDTRSWTPDETTAQAMELPGDAETALPVAQFGVTHYEGDDDNTDDDAYLMVYSPWPGFCDVLAVRASDTPVGPWTDAVEITFPNCSDTEDEYCYAATPQMQLCEPGTFAGGYYDMKTEADVARYFTFTTTFVVAHDR